MLHNLGQFRLRPEPGSIDTATQALIYEGKMNELTDLLGTLEPGDRDHAWVVDTHAALARVAARRTDAALRLVDCRTIAGDAGSGIAIAAYDPRLAAEVWPGDTVCAGIVASRIGDAEVRVEPRIYRTVCSNGAVVFAGTGEDRVARGYDVGEAVEACFAEGAFAATHERLVRAARTPVRDPISMLLALGLPVRVFEVLRAREDDDMSAFGWLNALTARARREPDPALRLAIERKAETLLQHALLQEPVPERSRAEPVAVT